ncbi:MAG: hypothetical protein KME16_12565 [Scytolyngbya sp. HA4215-MV1]|nr:hypothetical protein [Scytolyngbya sp. HA4215-MV1]
MPLTSTLLRLTWTVIEETPTSQLMLLTDTALVRLILQKMAQKMMLTGEEVYELYSYIGSKISLIRDIAESQWVRDHSRLPKRIVTQMPCSATIARKV